MFSKNMKWTIILVVIVLILIAVGLRMYQIGLPRPFSKYPLVAIVLFRVLTGHVVY
jgi:hypothetical protein